MKAILTDADTSLPIVSWDRVQHSEFTHFLATLHAGDFSVFLLYCEETLLVSPKCVKSVANNKIDLSSMCDSSADPPMYYSHKCPYTKLV